MAKQMPYTKLLVTRVSEITPTSCVIEGMGEVSSRTIRLPFDVFEGRGRRFRTPKLGEMLFARVHPFKSYDEAYEALGWYYEKE